MHGVIFVANFRILIENGYNMDRKFKWGMTPLELALRTQSEKCAVTLVLWGCSQKVKDDECETVSLFYQAASEGMTLLLRVLAKLNPYYYNENWLTEPKMPTALYTSPAVCEWLIANAYQPPTLFGVCQRKINQYVGKYSCTKLHKLPLPKAIIERLQLNEFVSGDFYKEDNVLEKTCPFDCLSTCPEKHCERIDISDSEEEM